MKHIRPMINDLKAIIIAGPGFHAETFHKYMFEQALAKAEYKLLVPIKPKFMKVHITSPHIHALMEALRSPEVRSTIIIYNRLSKYRW